MLLKQGFRCLSCRHALGRPGTGPAAAGSDGITLQTPVQLLDGQNGQYMIGSVHFSKPGDVRRTAASESSGLSLPSGSSSRPALDSILASARGQALLDSQVRHSVDCTVEILSCEPCSVYFEYELHANWQARL